MKYHSVPSGQDKHNSRRRHNKNQHSVIYLHDHTVLKYYIGMAYVQDVSFRMRNAKASRGVITRETGCAIGSSCTHASKHVPTSFIIIIPHISIKINGGSFYFVVTLINKEIPF